MRGSEKERTPEMEATVSKPNLSSFHYLDTLFTRRSHYVQIMFRARRIEFYLSSGEASKMCGYIFKTDKICHLKSLKMTSELSHFSEVKILERGNDMSEF